MSGSYRIRVFARGTALGWLVLSIATRGAFNITEEIANVWICSGLTAAATIAKLSVERRDMNFSLELVE